MYEAQLIKIIQNVFCEIAEDNDTRVRLAVCQFIISVCDDCDSKHNIGLLKILEKVTIYLLF